MASTSFADLGVSDAVCRALSARAIDAPFPIQALVTGDVIAGRDVLARSPTGSGKTLAFGIGLVERLNANGARPTGLVLAPTRELATQIVDELQPIAHARALRVEAVYGGVGIVKQARDAAKAHIVVATPGRLEDLMQRGDLSLDRIELLVLDEADRMLDMGFKPAVDRIVKACRSRSQTLFFSATLEGEAGRIAAAYTHDARRHDHAPAEERRPAIDHRFVTVEHEHKLKVLTDELQRSDNELAIVFVRTKRGADRLAKRLEREGIKAAAIHGDRSQRQRERALADFEGFRIQALVATDVAARGIDVQGVTHVINFDPPEDADAYVHRTGRTGRAGARGVGITFVMPEQHRDVAALADQLGIAHGLPVRAGGPKADGASLRARPQSQSQPAKAKRPAVQARKAASKQGAGAPKGSGTRSFPSGPRSGSTSGRARRRGPRQSA